MEPACCRQGVPQLCLGQGEAQRQQWAAIPVASSAGTTLTNKRGWGSSNIPAPPPAAQERLLLLLCASLASWGVAQSQGPMLHSQSLAQHLACSSSVEEARLGSRALILASAPWPQVTGPGIRGASKTWLQGLAVHTQSWLECILSFAIASKRHRRRWPLSSGSEAKSTGGCVVMERVGLPLWPRSKPA